MSNLINLCPPAPLESLSNYVARLSRLNYYRQAEAIRDLLPHPHSPFNTLRKWTDYQALADLTRQSPAALYDCTLHRFIPAYLLPEAYAPGPHLPLSPPRPLWVAQQLAQYGRMVQPLATCPECRAAAPDLLLLPWYLWHVTTCPLHGVPLRDRCLRCGAFVDGPRAALCTRCGAARPISLDCPLMDDAAGRQLTALVWQALGLLPRTLPPPAWAADHPCADLAPPLILQFLAEVAQFLVNRDPTHPFLTDPAVADPRLLTRIYGLLPQQIVAVRHHALSAAARLLLEWPTAGPLLFDRLAYAETHGARPHPAWPRWLARHLPDPHWRWLHTTWLVYMAGELAHNPRVASWLPAYQEWATNTAALPQLLTAHETAAALGVTYRTLQTYIEAEAVTLLPARKGARRYIAVGGVQTLATQRSTYLTQAQAAAYLGCDEPTVRQFVASGRLVVSLLDPFTGQVTRRYWFAPDALHTVLATLLTPLPVRPLPEAGEGAVLFFRQVVRRAQRVRVPLADLLGAIERTQLPVYRSDARHTLERLWFPTDAVDPYLRWERWGAGQVYYTGREAARLLRCKPRTLARWRAARLLTPRRLVETGGPVYLYDSRHIAAFRARYRTTRQAAALLGCAPATLRAWALAGQVLVACAPDAQGGHYRFDKEALQAWRATVLTVEEVTVAAGVSADTVYRWVRDGHLTPIGGRSRQRWWFLRAHVETWLGARAAWDARAVAVFLEISAATVYRWVAAGRLPTLRGDTNALRFNEAAIRAWRADHLTTPEVAAACQVSCKTIYRWIGSGRIQPLDEMGAGQHWFAQAVVAALLGRLSRPPAPSE